MTPIPPTAYRHLMHLAVVTHPEDTYYSLREPATELKPLVTAGYAERHPVHHDRYRVTERGIAALQTNESEDTR
jgi:hypothetical protein